MMRILVLFTCVVALTNGAARTRRIVGGFNAEPGQFPHQVFIRAGSQHICSGSIISHTKILTAAQCVYGNNVPLVVVAGSISLTTTIGIPVISAVYHPSYNPQTVLNDVAVLTLSLPLVYLPNIQPIQLANTNPEAGSTLTLSGWGLTSYPGNIPNRLQFISLATLDLQTCANMLLQVPTPITSGHVCTTSPVNQGACQGDSGGPLINANREQVGVNSWGIPCAKGNPDVFTSVASYRSWILSQ